MRRYIMVSGLVFALFTFVQALRFMRQWPVRVASFDVPLWASAVAAPRLEITITMAGPTSS